MPIPRELLETAIAVLPNSCILSMARHNGVPTDLRPRAKLVERLASDDGQNLVSYSGHMSIADLEKVAQVFGIDENNPGRNGLAFAVRSFIYDYDKNQEREKFHREEGVPRLSGALLLAEVQKMARPCVHLTTNPNDGRFAGVWRGPGIVPVNLPNHEHWITLNCTSLPEELGLHQLRGAASVYVNEGAVAPGDFNEGGCVALDPQCAFIEHPKPFVQIGSRTIFAGDQNGQALYARPGKSFPSVFQVMHSPTPPIRDWLTLMGYSFKPGDYSGLPAKELKDVYENTVTTSDPVLNDPSIVAVVGGWEVYIEFTYAAPIGDDDQFVFTLWESEPWIQVTIRKKTREFFVRQLIT